MLFERRCPGCGVGAPGVCSSCHGALFGPSRRVISRSLTAAGPLPVITAAASYDDRLARILVAAKNGGRRDLWPVLGAALASTVGEQVAAGVDVITFVPASRARRRERGYDQGRDLARFVGSRHDRPARRLLRRRGASSQHGGSRHQRLDGPTLTATRCGPWRILVVDDVATTGASLQAAANALISAGAAEVRAAVVGIADRG